MFEKYWCPGYLPMAEQVLPYTIELAGLLTRRYMSLIFVKLIKDMNITSCQTYWTPRSPDLKIAWQVRPRL